MGSQRVRHDWATSLSLSQVVLLAKSPPVSEVGQRHMFDPWVRKILWRRAWQPTPVFLPGESTEEPCGRATVHRVAKSRTRLNKFSRVCVYQFSSVAQLCLTLCDSVDCSTPGFPVYHHLPELTQTHGHWVGDPSNHLILCRPFLPPLIFPSIRVFSKDLVLCIRWPKYWSFSFSISPSNEYSGLISFRMDWLDLLAVQRTLKSFL